MTLSLSNATKTNVTMTNNDKGNDVLTFANADFTFDNAIGTFDTLRTPLSKQSKTNVTMSNDTKL